MKILRQFRAVVPVAVGQIFGSGEVDKTDRSACLPTADASVSASLRPRSKYIFPLDIAYE